MALCVWNIGVFGPTGNGSQMEGFVSLMTVNDSLMAKWETSPILLWLHPLVPYFWGHSHWQVLLVQKIPLGQTPDWPESGHMSDWDGKNGLLNVGSEWGMSHFMAITGYHWLNGYQKSGDAEPSEFFLGILSTNKPIWDTESWMSISLQWIILYSYSKIIKINVGNPKDPHAGQFVHRLRGKAQIAMLEKFAHKVHTHSHRPYNPYTIRMMFCVYTKVLCTPSMHGCSA